LKKIKRSSYAILVIVLLVSLVCWYEFLNSSTSVVSLTPTQLSELKTEARYIPYYSLTKYSETYMNEKVTISGEVSQVVENNGNDIQFLMIFSDNSSPTIGTVYVFYTKKPEERQILLNDTITLWGVSKGLFTYETPDGLLTNPRINASIIEVL